MSMCVLVPGGDGYCGWPTALYLSARGFTGAIVDSLVRQCWDRGVATLSPIRPLSERLTAWRELTDTAIEAFIGDVGDYDILSGTVQAFAPDAIVHFAEQRSAPYSMIDRRHAMQTQLGNVAGTFNVSFAMKELGPGCHLVKLGTMGEYGTPNIDIKEGFIEIEYRGRKDVLPFPKQPGSFYPLSKVHDSHNIMFCCRVWGLRTTDLNQGVVYGAATDETAQEERLINRLDYDEIFGTALNRFCVQAAIGEPLTVYGRGGQTRGFLDIRDTVLCIELACLNPPAHGEYRVFNQFTEQFSIGDLAHMVVEVAAASGIQATIQYLPDPRVEAEEHYYNAWHTRLASLGLQPHLLSQGPLSAILSVAMRYRDRVDAATLWPHIDWRKPSNKRPHATPSPPAMPRLATGSR